MPSSHQAQPLPHSRTCCPFPHREQYAIIKPVRSRFSFDFTKAFDTVRHATLMSKMAQLQIPDNIYNWIMDFFEEHHHCTRYAGHCSSVTEVKASVIKGSGGPVSYIVTAADLYPVTAGNRIFKYADDTYLVVPAANTGS